MKIKPKLNKAKASPKWEIMEEGGVFDKKILKTQRNIAKNAQFSPPVRDTFQDIPQGIENTNRYINQDQNAEFQKYGSPEEYYQKFPTEKEYNIFQNIWDRGDLGTSRYIQNDEILMANGGLTSNKAKEILKDGTAQGHPLTSKQKRYFGYIAGGGTPKKADGGYNFPNPSNYNLLYPHNINQQDSLLYDEYKNMAYDTQRNAKDVYNNYLNKFQQDQLNHPSWENDIKLRGFQDIKNNPLKFNQKANGGGLFNTDKKAYVDSVLNANKNLDFVKRLYDGSMGSIQVPGEKYRSTHLMSNDGNRVYPEVINRNGKLEHLTGDDAWNYADTSGQYITLDNPQEADWFASNGYKQGTNVLKYIDNKGIPKKAQGGMQNHGTLNESTGEYEIRADKPKNDLRYKDIEGVANPLGLQIKLSNLVDKGDNFYNEDRLDKRQIKQNGITLIVPELHSEILQSYKPNSLQGNNQQLEFNPIGYTKGSYFTRPQQGQEIGGLEYFDKQTGKKLQKFGGKIKSPKWEIID